MLCVYAAPSKITTTLSHTIVPLWYKHVPSWTGKSTPSSLEYGCQLSPSVSSSKLRSSIYTLLNEMNKNQIDINNVRILKDMEDLMIE